MYILEHIGPRKTEVPKTRRKKMSYPPLHPAPVLPSMHPFVKAYPKYCYGRGVLSEGVGTRSPKRHSSVRDVSQPPCLLLSSTPSASVGGGFGFSLGSWFDSWSSLCQSSWRRSFSPFWGLSWLPFCAVQVQWIFRESLSYKSSRTGPRSRKKWPGVLGRRVGLQGLFFLTPLPINNYTTV